MFLPSLSALPTSESLSASAESASADARRDARSAKTATALLQWDIERLMMLTEALWTLLKEAHGYTDADLIRLVAEIDARDGRIDGRVAPTPPALCPSCGRVLARKRPTCLYCGKPVIDSPFAR